MAAVQCRREAESHGGPLRKIDGAYVCQQCSDKEHGIERKKAKGKPLLCPNCGIELMTRYRKGGISVKSLSTRGNKAILKCECGYEKVIKNPFGGNASRDEAARRRLISEARANKCRMGKDGH